MRWDGDPHEQGNVCKVNDLPDVETAFKSISLISTVLVAPVVVDLSWWCLPATFLLGAVYKEVRWCYCAMSIMLGLESGLILDYADEYYTSRQRRKAGEDARTHRLLGLLR